MNVENVDAEIVREAMSILGSRTSPAKAKAAKRNGSAPCRKGRRRGWPKGKPRKPGPEPAQ